MGLLCLFLYKENYREIWSFRGNRKVVILCNSGLNDSLKVRKVNQGGLVVELDVKFRCKYT